MNLYPYNDIVTFIEENLDVAAVKAFEDQIIYLSITAAKQLVYVMTTLFLEQQAIMLYLFLMMPLQCTDLLKQFTRQGPQPRAEARAAHGPAAKTQKAEARRRRAQGETLAELARSYGVGKSTISRLTV